MSNRFKYVLLAVSLCLGTVLTPVSAEEPETTANASAAVLGSASGTITGPDGEAVAGTLVTVVPASNDYWRYFTYSDEEGNYSLSWTASSSDRAIVIEVNALDGSFQPYSTDRLAPDGINQTIDMTLKPYWSISGRVVDTAGLAAANIYVTDSSSYSLTEPVMTDTFGRFTIDGAADGEHKLRFVDPANQLATTWLGGGTWHGASTEITVTADYTGILQVLPPGHTISGYLRSSAGVGIGNYLVELSTFSGGWAYARTDSTGQFVFGGLHDDRGIMKEVKDGTIQEVRVSSAESATVERPVAWVSGTISEADGTPRPGVCPFLNWSWGYCSSFGPHGEYSMAIAPGLYTTIRTSFNPDNGYSFYPVENEVVDLNFTVAPRERIEPAPNNLNIAGSNLDTNGLTHVGTGVHPIVVTGCPGGIDGSLIGGPHNGEFTFDLTEDSATPGTYRGFLATVGLGISGPTDITVKLNCPSGVEETSGHILLDRHLKVIDQNGAAVKDVSVVEHRSGSIFGPFRPREAWDVADLAPAQTYPYKGNNDGYVTIDSSSGWRQFTVSKNGCDEATTRPVSAALPHTPMVLRMTCSGEAAAQSSGYWMLERDATIYGFGSAPGYASSGIGVAISTTPNGAGLWVLHSDGTIVVKGGAVNYGNVDLSALDPGEVVSAISVLSNGTGYWVYTNRGRAINFGAAKSYGDMTAYVLNGPVVASAATPTGLGYYMIGTDGGVFAFGDAKFAGSMGGIPLNQAVVGIAPDPDNDGYWLVAADGGIFAFNANFEGSAGSLTLNAPVVGAVAYANAYLLVAADGGIFNYSNKPFLGSLGSNPPDTPILSVAAYTN